MIAKIMHEVCLFDLMWLAKLEGRATAHLPLLVYLSATRLCYSVLDLGTIFFLNKDLDFCCNVDTDAWVMATINTDKTYQKKEKAFLGWRYKERVCMRVSWVCVHIAKTVVYLLQLITLNHRDIRSVSPLCKHAAEGYKLIQLGSTWCTSGRFH